MLRYHTPLTPITGYQRQWQQTVPTQLVPKWHIRARQTVGQSAGQRERETQWVRQRETANADDVAHLMLHTFEVLVLVTFPFILLLHFVLFLFPPPLSVLPSFACHLNMPVCLVPPPSSVSQLCKFLKANKLCRSLMSCRLAFHIVLRTKASRNLLESLLKFSFQLSFYQFWIVPFYVCDRIGEQRNWK